MTAEKNALRDLNVLQNLKKQQKVKIKWYEQDKNQKMIQKIVNFLRKKVCTKDEEQYLLEKVNKAIQKKFKQSLIKIFKINEEDEFWNFLEEKQILKSKTSADGQMTLISLINNKNNTNNNENGEDGKELKDLKDIKDISEPPFKKRKLIEHINDYNDGKINETKLTKRLLKRLNKLQTKHEIHFYFTIPNSQIQDSSIESDSDQDNY